jgi:methyl-accepting chemotaxis protein
MMDCQRRHMKLKIGAKLIGGFSIVIVLMLAIFGVGYIGMSNSVKSIHTINVNKDEDFYWASWKADILRAGFDFEAFFSTNNERWLQDAQIRISNSNISQSALADVLSPSRQAEFDTVAALVPAIMGQYQERVNQINSGDMSAMQTTLVIEDVGQKMDALINTVNSTIEKSKMDTAVAITAAEKAQTWLTLMMIAIAVVALLVASLLGILLSRGISSGINKVKNALKSMASGDLTVKVDIKSKDEVGEMAQSYNEMQNHMSTLIAQFKQSAVQLNAASDQLATAAKQSSESTQQVATSAQQMAKGAQEQSTID